MLLRSLFAAMALAPSLLAQLYPPFVPPENPLTPAKVMLGKILFWDEQLSSDDTVACGTCHQPEFGGSDGRLGSGLHPGPDDLFGTEDDIHGSAGVVRQTANGAFRSQAPFGFATQVTPRIAPTTLGAAYHAELFWDGRADSAFADPETGQVLIPLGAALENQALGPILNPAEMARQGRTWSDVRAKLQQVEPLALASNLPTDMVGALQQNPTYPTLFAAAFGDPTISAARIAFALASYQRTQIPDDTPWDRYVAGDTDALDTTQKSGWIAFQAAPRCAFCHPHPTFSDDMFHNLGLRFLAEDPGRGAISLTTIEAGAFKTPTLRNAGLRPRLFHNGQSPPLGDPTQESDPNSVRSVYRNGGGVDSSNLDDFMAPLASLGVQDRDLDDILEFVRTGLTDQRAALRLPPFDHPDLRSTTALPPRVFGAPRPGHQTPFLIAHLPTFPGNDDFRLGLVGGRANGFGMLSFGVQSIEPSLSWFGLPLHVEPLVLLPFGFGGPSGAVGQTTLPMPIPDVPGLVSVPFYFQLFAVDTGAPLWLASSRGYELTVQ